MTVEHRPDRPVDSHPGGASEAVSSQASSSPTPQRRSSSRPERIRDSCGRGGRHVERAFHVEVRVDAFLAGFSNRGDRVDQASLQSDHPATPRRPFSQEVAVAGHQARQPSAGAAAAPKPAKWDSTSTTLRSGRRRRSDRAVHSPV